MKCINIISLKIVYNFIMLTYSNCSNNITLTAGDIAWGSLMYVMMLATVFGNTAVIIIIARTTPLHTLTNVLILSLAAGDLLIGVLIMPFCATSRILGMWRFSTEYCKLTGFISNVGASSTLLNLTMISIDRGLAVTKPLKYSVLITVPSTVTMIAFVWIPSSLFALLPIFEVGLYEYVPARSTCVLNWKQNNSYTILLGVFCIGIPMILISCMIVSILRTSYAQRRIFVTPIATTAGMPLPNSARQSSVSNYRRTTFQAMKTLFLILFALAILWIPNLVMSFLDTYGQFGIPTDVLTLTTWLAFLSSMINPCIFLSNKIFKQRFREIFCCSRVERRIGGYPFGYSHYERTTYTQPTSSSFTQSTPGFRRGLSEGVSARNTNCGHNISVTGINTIKRAKSMIGAHESLCDDDTSKIEDDKLRNNDGHSHLRRTKSSCH